MYLTCDFDVFVSLYFYLDFQLVCLLLFLTNLSNNIIIFSFSLYIYDLFKILIFYVEILIFYVEILIFYVEILT